MMVKKKSKNNFNKNFYITLTASCVIVLAIFILFLNLSSDDASIAGEAGRSIQKERIANYEINNILTETRDFESYVLNNYDTMNQKERETALIIQTVLLRQYTEVLADIALESGIVGSEDADTGSGFTYPGSDSACDSCVNGCVDVYMEDPEGMSNCVSSCCNGACSQYCS